MAVAVDSREARSMLQIHLKQLQTDSFRAGVTVYVGKTNAVLCLVSAVLACLPSCETITAWPNVYLYRDGSPLTSTGKRQCAWGPNTTRKNKAATVAHQAGVHVGIDNQNAGTLEI